MDITVFVDASGSMSVLGKKSICESLVQTLSLLRHLDSRFSDVHFTFENVLMNQEVIEKLQNAQNKILLLTDGFDIGVIENCNIAVVLIGEDSISVEKKNYFKAIDVLNAADYLMEEYE